MDRHLIFGVLAACAVVATGCEPASSTTTAGTTPAQTPSASAVATPRATPTATIVATPSASATPSGAASPLAAVAAKVYPVCGPSSCVANRTGYYTTCDTGNPARFSACPFTPRLIAQLMKDIQGVNSAPEPIGGGQDPEWETEAITTDLSATGGVAHVALGFTGSSQRDQIDLIMVPSDGQLFVDDVNCTGTDPATSDAYATGWLNRSTCAG
jgi:hypothetical protein